jgi:hypothetical protein
MFTEIGNKERTGNIPPFAALFVLASLYRPNPC